MKQRLRAPKFQEHYKQAQLFFNSLAPHEKQHVIAALTFELSHCDDPQVYELYSRILNNVDFELAKQVATNVGGVVPDKPVRENPGHSSRLSQLHFLPKQPTIKSRRIAILVADGFNLREVEALRAAIKAGSATTWIIGPRRGPVYPEGSKDGYSADHHYEGQRSTMFDALIIPSGAKHAQSLANNGRTIHWVREAFGHCKAIGALGEGMSLLCAVSRAGVLNTSDRRCCFPPRSRAAAVSSAVHEGPAQRQRRELVRRRHRGKVRFGVCRRGRPQDCTGREGLCVCLRVRA